MTSENIAPTPGNAGDPPPRAGSISTTPSPAGGARHCPACGAAVINRSATRCWMCEAPLPATWDDSVVTRDWVDASEPRRSATNAGLVFLGVMLLFLGIGLAGVAPGVLIVLLLILTPVLIRTTRGGSDGTTPGRSDKGPSGIEGFFSTLAVVALIGLTSIATFYVTCFAVCLAGVATGSLDRGGNVLILSVTSGVVAALLVLVALIRRMRRKRGGA